MRVDRCGRARLPKLSSNLANDILLRPSDPMHQHRFSTAFSGAIAVVCVALALAACTGDAEPDVPPTSPRSRRSRRRVRPPRPRRPRSRSSRPPPRGPVAADCVDGWVTPPRDSHRYEEPLRMIRRVTGVRGPLEVVDLRSFDGPESPPSDKGYLLDIQRWYVKASRRTTCPSRVGSSSSPGSSGPVWSRSRPTTRTASGHRTGSGSSSTAATPRRGRTRGCRACGPGCRTTSSPVARDSRSPDCRTRWSAACRRPDRSRAPPNLRA